MLPLPSLPQLREAALVLVLTLVLTSLAASSRSSARTEPRAGRCSNARVLHHWTLRRLAWQTVVVPVDENAVAVAAPAVAAGAGGIILFGSHAPRDLRRRIDRVAQRAPGGIRPLVMADEEGGTVQRLANLVGSLPSAREMGARWSPARIQSAARRVAVRMRHVGVTMDLAPVLDLDGRAGPSSANSIGTRSFSPRRTVATPAGLAFARGLRNGGVVPVVKHFPGMGAASGNTDLRRAATPPWTRLRRDGLLPFRTAVRSGLPAVMVSNVYVPGLTRKPASISRAVVHRVLRRQLGFRGLVVPDSLSAGAVRASGYSVVRAGVRGIAVGEDLVLFTAITSQVMPTSRRIVAAEVSAVVHHRLPRARLESAAGHVLRAKHVQLCRR